MSLLGLPTELLDYIVELTLANGRCGGFQGIVRSCKTLYKVGESHAPRYKELCQWQNLRIGTSPNTTWPSVLQAVITEPILGAYVETLNLTECDSQCEWSEEMVDLLMGNDREKFRQLLINSPWLALAGVNVEDWETIMLMNGPDSSVDGIYRTVFLLTLLPQLKTLTLPSRWSLVTKEGEDCMKVLNVLLENAHNPSSRPSLPLGHLERLFSVEPIEYDTYPRGGFAVVEPFMIMPSLKELWVSNLIAVDDGHTGIPFAWTSPNHLSNLQRVHLQGCCVDAGGIDELLSRMPSLQSLRHSHATKYHGCEHDWNAGAFVAAVAENSSETLVEFALTLNLLPGDIEQGITSLKAFKSLRKIEIDWNYFAAPPVDSDMSNGMGADAHSWTLAQMPSLLDILPAGIEHVSLVCNKQIDNVEPLRSLFRDAICLPQSAAFSALQSVQIKHHMKIEDWNKKLDAVDSEVKERGTGQTPFQSLRSLLETAGAQYHTI